MVFQLEVVIVGYFQLNLFNLWHNKFFDSSAVYAYQVVMVGPGRNVFVVLN